MFSMFSTFSNFSDFARFERLWRVALCNMGAYIRLNILRNGV